MLMRGRAAIDRKPREPSEIKPSEGYPVTKSTNPRDQNGETPALIGNLDQQE